MPNLKMEPKKVNTKMWYALLPGIEMILFVSVAYV